MLEKEYAELRRRVRPEKCNISRVRGCMVGASGEILSRFDLSTGPMNETECEQIYSIFRKTLSGKKGKNLHDLSFTTAQVESSDEHRLLTALRSSALADDGAVEKLYEKIASAVSAPEGGFLILLTHDTYDILSYRSDGSDGESVGSFPYILCCICPLKLTKAILHYAPKDAAFEMLGADSAVVSPTLGFLYPAFDDRCANIYAVSLYTRDVEDDPTAFIDTLFHTSLPMPQYEQKATFREILADAAGDACDLTLLTGLQSEVTEMMEEYKQSGERDPLLLGKTAVTRLLLECGLPEEKAPSFEKKFEERYGVDAELPPEALTEPKKYELETPEVKIKVDPAHRDLISTRVIDGVKYILVRADSDAALNGMNLHIE